MTAIRNAATACTRSFRVLAAALEGGDAEYRSLIGPAALEDEFGRFRVWAGNLGAQQKGHSSLDYRLRDSPLLQSNVLKLLQELAVNLDEARAVVAGARLPYEQQAARGDFSDDSASEDSEEDEDISEEEQPKYELQQRLFEIIDIVNHLYRLSIRIRSPTVRTRALKAAAYRQIDPETGVDIFSQYAEYDKRYMEDSLSQLRAGRKADDLGYLVDRLSRAITRRRQQFKYWKKHRDKLSNLAGTEMSNLHVADDDKLPKKEAAVGVTDDCLRTSELAKINLRAPPSESNPRTLLSGTEATTHHRTLDDAVDSQSVTSIATTAKDIEGHGVDLPPPPHSADGERDFECPYCFVICPARHSRMRAWKTHLLQDLQPYVCTYRDCNDSDQMFRSRREWLEHESSAHRKVWRCPSHPAAVYSSQEGMRSHLEDNHNDDLSEMQKQQVISLAEISTNDLREHCPICLVHANDNGVDGNLHNHIANHLERLASFALPKFAGTNEGKSVASMDVSDGKRSDSEHSQLRSLQWSVDTPTNDDTTTTKLIGGMMADELTDHLLELLEHGRLPRWDYSDSDWHRVRPYLNSHFPNEVVSRLIPFLDKIFHEAGDNRIMSETIRMYIHRLASEQETWDRGTSGLSLDAVKSVPDASKEKMVRFLEDTEQADVEDENLITSMNEVPEKPTNAFEIHTSEVLQEAHERNSPTDDTTKPDEPCIVRVYNLPSSPEEREAFAQSFSALGSDLHLGPAFESRGYATFKSQMEAEGALTAFDKSKFPDVIFSLDKDDEGHGNGIVPIIEFDVKRFLDTLIRVLGEPGSGQFIAWAEDGKTFSIQDEERFIREILPVFELDAFPQFQDRLIACGFRQQIGQQFKTDAGGLNRTSIWSHKHFERDRQGAHGRIPFFVKLQKLFSRTKGRPLVSQLDKVDTTINMSGFSGFSKKPRSAFALMAGSDIPSILDLYRSGWLETPTSAAADAYSLLPREDINQKISILQHDITMLNVDAIVNATGSTLDAGLSDSISYWIHQAAGPGLLRECTSLGFCERGQAVVTDAYDLPCRKIIHTVRPHYFEVSGTSGQGDLLASCYRSCLRLAVEKKLKTIAFPCLSAGGFGYPTREAAEIALKTTREFMDSSEGDRLKKIVFCVYKNRDHQIYRALVPLFFPPNKIDLAFYGEQEVRKETPNFVEDDSLDDTLEKDQEDVFDMELDAAGHSRATRLNESAESLSRLTGGPSLWACCKCRARPMETPNCLICYHQLCDSCEGESSDAKPKYLSSPPHLFLVYLRPSANVLDDTQQSNFASIDQQGLSDEDHTRGSVRSRANSPTRNYRPTFVKAHRKHLSLDTLFYYGLPFQFDSHDQDYVIITRELNEEQTDILFRHSRRHRRNLPSLIRIRTHPSPRDSAASIRIGSDPSFNNQYRPAGAPFFVPEPFVTADHCGFYIEAGRQWMLNVNQGSGSTFLNGRRLVRLPAVEEVTAEDEETGTPALPSHNHRGYFVKSGDILGLGENNNGRPAHLFRVELDSVGATEDDLWEEAEARASRYGFPTIGLDEDDDSDNNDGGNEGHDDRSSRAGDTTDAETDIDPDIASGFRIVPAPTEENTVASHIPEQARGASRWTRIDRRIVNPAVLKEAGLFFENRVRYLLVFRELSAGEVARLAQRTKESREVKMATEFTRKERRRKERRVREQVKVARERKKGAMEREGGG